ncbi:MAG: hypothetical protein QI223_02815, partial [Candidatus Korarchaeota archaeon]|nr:hypothetical protein [Candidatus Korarchaeota archaeon]
MNGGDSIRTLQSLVSVVLVFLIVFPYTGAFGLPNASQRPGRYIQFYPDRAEDLLKPAYIIIFCELSTPLEATR